MKKLFVFLTGILLFVQHGYAQNDTIKEGFDAGIPAGWSNPTGTNPSGAWIPEATYFIPNPSGLSSQSLRGKVPILTGDSCILETPVYDFSVYDYIYLKFSHICKIAPSDIARIEFREDSAGVKKPWQVLPASSYRGNSASYAAAPVFNAAAYPEWTVASNLAIPTQGWWKDELFVLGTETGKKQVQFRFIIRHGNAAGTQIAYGWLIENLELTASVYAIDYPTVRLTAPFVRDTVYGTGPWEIRAEAISNSWFPLPPTLQYEAVYNSQTSIDAIPMSLVYGDIWAANIPQFPVGTQVSYAVTGIDALGNKITDRSGYAIVKPLSSLSGYVIVGTDKTIENNLTPTTSTFTKGWSRQLYLASELSPTSSGGTISELAWDDAYNTVQIPRNPPQKMFLKAVPSNVTSVTAEYVDPMIDGATLVYQSSLYILGGIWVNIPLIRPFYLPPNHNLMVYWINDSDPESTAGTSVTWFHSSTEPVYRAVYLGGGGSIPTGNGNLTYDRPNLRVFFTEPAFGTNSVSTFSIDIDDVVPTASAGVFTQIVATVKNRGSADLDSVTIAYSVNGGSPVSKMLYFNPPLSWDFNYQDNLGQYTAKLNDYDTIKVWVSHPNGVLDSVTTDDTLTKIVHGTSDIVVKWIEVPKDTVHNTGPHEVTARIYSLSGLTQIIAVPLYIESVLNSVISRDSVQMQHQGGDIWTAYIPHIRYGSEVTYTVKLQDSMGNDVESSGSYYIERQAGGGGLSGYVICGTGTLSDYYTPYTDWYRQSWSRQLYLSNEISTTSKGGNITELAWDYMYTAGHIHNYQQCYFKAVDDVNISSAAYADPVASGATLVWQGNMNVPAGRIWANVPLTQSFTLPPGKNLMIYWNNGHGVYTISSPLWYHTATPNYMTAYGYQDYTSTPGYPPVWSPASISGNFTYNRPNARFLIEDDKPDVNNSVSMNEIVSPSRGMAIGAIVPVTVRIRNEGMKDLDSCYVNWSLNGTIQIPAPGYVYRNGEGLPEDFTDTITLGYYPQSPTSDTIVVWVSMPNGVIDSIISDDTLKIEVFGCSPILANSVLTVGAGRDFTTINAALQALRNCGADHDITLELNGTFTENLNLTDINDFMNGYHLTIISEGNHRDSAVIRPTSGVIVTLNKSDNLTLEGLTFNGRPALSYVVQFTGACTNVTIRNCNLLSDTTTTSNVYEPLYKASGTGIVDGFYLINCLLDGGYYGAYFIGGTSYSEYSQMSKVVWDSNIFKNSYLYAMNTQYIYFKSFSHNTVLSRTNSTTYWFGIHLYYGGVEKVVGNKVIQRSPTITYAYGAYIYYNNMASDAPQRNMLVANNEIRLNYNTNSGYGMYVYYNGYGYNQYTVNILNNSLHLTGMPPEGIRIYNPNARSVVKNNLIYMEGAAAYPIYLQYTPFSTNYYDVDYNNMYAPVYVGWSTTPHTTLSSWQSVVTTDQHSTAVIPVITDQSLNLNPSGNLKLVGGSFASFICPSLAAVTDDIEGKVRGRNTTMGCYNSIPPGDFNLSLIEFTGLREGEIIGQTDQVSIYVINTAVTPITSVNIGWTIDGLPQTPVTHQVSLSMGQSTTLVLGPITYAAGNKIIKAWINSVNNVLDDYRPDDTLSAVNTVCSGGFSGVMNIGSNSTYRTLEEALTAIDVCGVAGDVTFAFETGVYNRNFDFTGGIISTARFGNYNLTITSASGNADDVVFRASGGAGILLGNTKNLIIKAITVDARTNLALYAIQFNAACTNVVIRDCNLLHDTTTTSSTHFVVYKPSAGISSNISFINNLIEGGYYGWYFYGGTGTAAYGNNFVFDSNTVRNQYNYATYTYYINFASYSYNTIISRTATTTWYGLHANYVNGPVIGNHIVYRGTTATIYPIQSNYYHYSGYGGASTTLRGLIANNEIICQSGTGTCYGIYNAYNFAAIVNNSFYHAGESGTHYGVYMTTSSNVIIENNYIVGTSPNAYPIYLSSGTFTSDYNNLYAPNYVGYSGGARGNMDEWQNAVPSDRHSVKVAPAFTNTAINLDLSLWNDSLNCPQIASVSRDINNRYRYPTTKMGAYERIVDLDLMAVRIQQPDNRVINNQTVTVSLDVRNTGYDNITQATFGWTVNGSPMPTASHNFSLPLGSYEEDNVPFIGTFHVTNANNQYDVVVWVESINTVPDTINWNDTARATYRLAPFANFTTPLVNDTIYTLNFDVYVEILEGTGAPATTPLYLVYHTIIGGCLNETDSALLEQDITSGKWIAKIPKRYFNSKVIYELHLSDKAGNSLVLMDSTLILYAGVGGTGGDYAYTGSVDTVILRPGTYEIECWGAESGISTRVPSHISGKGGYTKGTIQLKKTTTFYVYVGQKGANALVPSWNGGGAGATGTSVPATSGAGGGATDIRLMDGTWNDVTSLNSRIMVAGGGGGTGDYSAAMTGGHAGGLIGLSEPTNVYPGNSANGGTQLAGGTTTPNATLLTNPGSLGTGGNGNTSSYAGAGGGGGYYGGGGGNATYGAGGGGSSYISGYVGCTNHSSGLVFTNTTMIDGATSMPSPTGTNEMGHTGHGFIRITSLTGGGGGGSVDDVYPINNLSLTSVASPASSSEFCEDAMAPVTVVLANLGIVDYDFTVDNITIAYEISNPASKTFITGTKPVTTGTLLSGETNEIVIEPSLPLGWGTYTIKAWVISAKDAFICDDTVVSVYASRKYDLPIDEDFSSPKLREEFYTETWEVHPYSAGDPVQPDFGTGVLRHSSGAGGTAELIVRHLSLTNVIDPKLEFWYYHDPTTPSTDHSRMYVDVIADNAEITVLTLFKRDTAQGWTYYTVDLNPYKNAHCVLLRFSTLNTTQQTQYIDRIYISAQQNLAVDAILIRGLAICDFENKDVQVVIHNTAGTNMDFSINNTGIYWEVLKGTTLINSDVYPLNSGTVNAYSFDTITLATMDFDTGTYYLNAWLTIPVDNTPSDDTTRRTLPINPDVSIRAVPNTNIYDATTCFPMNRTATQDVVIRNIGNFDVYNLSISLDVHSNSIGIESSTDTLRGGVLKVGDSIRQTFPRAYVVPMDNYYIVVVKAELSCDVNPADNVNNIQECVDLNDIEVVRITKPNTTHDNVGEAVNLEVEIKNWSKYDSYDNVAVNVEISDGTTFSETINRLPPDSALIYAFNRSYTVPMLNEYRIKVYINRRDADPSNDTIEVIRKTNLGTITPVGNKFALGQNVPNPAKDNTYIEYYLPEDGQLIFTVYTITGQILHTETKEANSGESKLEFNTINLANGIYYYSMEYKGERLVKKMTIRK